MKRTLVFHALLGISACGPFHYRATMPRPPYCVVGGTEPLAQSMDDYGSTYTPGLNGPASSPDDTYLVPESEAGPTCVAPPTWFPSDKEILGSPTPPVSLGDGAP
jgi:hypothetical protein